MSASTCHLKGAFHKFLAFDFGKIEIKRSRRAGKLCTCIYFSRCHVFSAVDKPGSLCQAVHTVNFKIIDHSGFADIGRRYNHTLKPHFPGLDSHRQNSFYGKQSAVKRQFSHYHVLPEPFGRNLTVGREHSYGYGQIVGRTFFSDIGRRHVYQDFPVWRHHLAFSYGAHDSGVTFFHGSVCQTDNGELEAFAHRHLDGDGQCVNPLYCGSENFYKHTRGVLFR